MTQFETRSFVEPVEFRSEGTRIVASGVAMRYGAKSKPIPHAARGVFREQFKDGAFTKTLQESDVRCHDEHDGPYLARTANGTLRLVDGRSELGYEIDLPDTTAGRDAAVKLERKDVQGSSIGFRSIKAAETWSRDDDGMALRTVGEARLFRVDLTISPAYDDSTAEMALRSFAEANDLELRSVLDAVDAGVPLLNLLDEQEQRSDEEENGGRESTVVRPHILGLYL